MRYMICCKNYDEGHYEHIICVDSFIKLVFKLVSLKKEYKYIEVRSCE